MKKNNYLATHTSYNIVNFKKNLKSIRYARDLDYSKLLKSCDIGLSTVVLSKKILHKLKKPFPPLKTKEDYVLWLKLLKMEAFFMVLIKYLRIGQITLDLCRNRLIKNLKMPLKFIISIKG